MPNYLKMPKQQQVTALLALNWSYRRIEVETGVRRETVSRYDRRAKANAAKVFPGSTLRLRCTAAAYRTAIMEQCDAGLSAQRIWQDLVEEYGYGASYGASYESVKRFIRTLPSSQKRAVGVFHCAPGAEGQVDFFRGAPTLDATTGEWHRSWVFRLTLSHSRHGYEECVWDQRVETFLRLHERAFRLLQGVLQLTRRFPRERLLAAVEVAHAQQQFRYRTIRRLVEAAPRPIAPARLAVDPLIRPMAQYALPEILA